MIQYDDPENPKVAVQPNESAKVVAVFERSHAGSPRGSDPPAASLMAVGDRLYYRESQYGTVTWSAVSTESGYEAPEEKSPPMNEHPEFNERYSLHHETEHILEALFTQVLDERVGIEKDHETGEQYKPQSNKR